MPMGENQLKELKRQAEEAIAQVRQGYNPESMAGLAVAKVLLYQTEATVTVLERIAEAIERGQGRSGHQAGDCFCPDGADRQCTAGRAKDGECVACGACAPCAVYYRLGMMTWRQEWGFNPGDMDVAAGQVRGLPGGEEMGKTLYGKGQVP